MSLSKKLKLQEFTFFAIESLLLSAQQSITAKKLNLGTNTNFLNKSCGTNNNLDANKIFITNKIFIYCRTQ